MRRIVLGAQTDGTYGVRCSSPGYDAGSDPVDETQLSFSSDWNTTLPVVQSGSLLSIANNTTYTFSFTSISYIPLGFFLWRPAGSGAWYNLPGQYSSGNVVLLVATYIDHVKIINNCGQAIDIAYALFYAATQ